MLEISTHVFSCEYCESFKDIYFEEHLQTAASVTKALIALYSFKLLKHSQFLVFTTLHVNSATKIKEHCDISYNSNIFML